MINKGFIADLAYEYPAYSKQYVKVGALFVIVNDNITKIARIRIGKEFDPDTHGLLIGLFRKLESIQEAPFVEGELMLNHNKIGFISSEQNAVGDTIYWARILKCPDELPKWIKVGLV